MAMQSMAEMSKRMRSSTTQDKLLITKHTSRNRPMLVFYIGSNLCKQCRFKAGDKLDVLWDEDINKGLIMKHEGGKTLVILNSSGGRGVLSFTWRKGMPDPDTTNGPLEIKDMEWFSDDEELHFTFPEGCTF